MGRKNASKTTRRLCVSEAVLENSIPCDSVRIGAKAKTKASTTESRSIRSMLTSYILMTAIAHCLPRRPTLAAANRPKGYENSLEDTVGELEITGTAPHRTPQLVGVIPTAARELPQQVGDSPTKGDSPTVSLEEDTHALWPASWQLLWTQALWQSPPQRD